MIRSLELKFFRKHTDTKIDFTAGLNVLRGPNEIGKTTITEGILYCLYGASALIDKLELVVTWGHKESELWGRMVITVSATDYVFTRSKAGAECNYAGVDGKVIKVTGQKEVSAFSAQLLGADAKTAAVLMLASQAGLRGALDDGPTAVSSLMGKLADFDLVDRILENASATLSLGSVAPLQQKLTEASNAVTDASAALVDPAMLAQLGDLVSVQQGAVTVAEVRLGELQEISNKADDARVSAQTNNTSHGVAVQTIVNLNTTLTTERSRLLAAETDAAKVGDSAVLAGLRSKLVDAKNHKFVFDSYLKFQSIPVYPDVAWDDTKETFDASLAQSIERRDETNLMLRENDSDQLSLARQIISGDGKCPTCGHVAENHAHVIESNAAVQLKIDALRALRPGLLASLKEANDEIETMNSIVKIAKARQVVIDQVKHNLSIDINVYPGKVSWLGTIPDSNGPDVAAIERQIATFEQQERLTIQAEGRASAHRAAITDQVAAIDRAERILAEMRTIDMGPLQAAYETAYAACSAHSMHLMTLRSDLSVLEGQKWQADQQAAAAQALLATAQSRVAEYTKDIETLEFNNELVKKLKSMKPMITDHLWNSVLAAVSNFFSTLRGEQSIVSKDAEGFKVNGRGGSLSGSTLDMLALAIRVALSKTFVPHANFMVLDEPAHGCDNDRTTNLLGFLAGVGFNQTILASHDEVSEAVADNVINLGA